MINLGQKILGILPTNALKGKNGRDEIIARLRAQGHPDASATEVIAVDVNKTFEPANGSSNCFYEQAAGDWKVALSRVKDIHYAFVVYEDVVLEIYEIAHWTEKKKDAHSVFRGQPILRPVFNGKTSGDTLDIRYLGHPLSTYIGQTMTNLTANPQHAALPSGLTLSKSENPVRYYTIFFE